MRSPEPLQRAAGFFALLCVGVLILMQARPSFTNASRPQNGIPDPVLSLQMAHGLYQVDAVLGDAPSPDREVMRAKQYEDFAFIACYTALYLALSLLLGIRYSRARWIAVIAALAGMGAAALDVVENIAILHVVDLPLAQTTQSTIDAIHHTSLVKWALGFIALGLLSPYFLWDRRGIARGVGLLYAVACILGLIALYDHVLLVYAAGLIGLGLCGTVVLLLFLPLTRWGTLKSE